MTTKSITRKTFSSTCLSALLGLIAATGGRAAQNTSVSSAAESGTTFESEASDYVITRRAPVLRAGATDASFAIRSANGFDGQSPESAFTGRIGLGADLMLHVAATYGANASSWKPGAGLRWEFLGGRGRDLTMSAGAQLRKGALSEPDGEGEADLDWAGTFRRGSAELSLNLRGGIDLDGDTDHFEAQVAAGYYLSDRLMTGIEGETRWAVRNTELDLSGDVPGPLYSTDTHFAGPYLQYQLASVILSGAVGVSLVRDARLDRVVSAQALFRASVPFSGRF